MATPQATPFDTILAQCRDLACERLAQALSAMLHKADEALSALMQETRDPNTQKLYLVTRNKVMAQRETIEKQFRMRFLREFQERSNQVKKIGESFAAIDLSSLELELVAEEDLNETLKFNAMATKLRQYCDEELIALDQRVGVLIGDASLQAEDNPFTPQTICDAYKQTCQQIDTNVDVRMVLLKLFDDHVLDDIRAVYRDVNALLVQNAILPKIRIQRARGAAASESQEGQPAAAGEDKDLFAVLQKLLVKPATPAPDPVAGNRLAQTGGTLPGVPPVSGQAAVTGEQAAGAQPNVTQGADLLRSLTRIQLGDASAVAGLPIAVVAGEPGTTNILHELKGTSLGGGMNPMDSMTLDIMAMLFDQLFDDPKIPANVKGVIGRLQIPMLKVAIADKSFFSRKTHPARRMLDTLGEIAARMPADIDASDEVFERLDSILQELIVGFEDDVKIFDAIRERLEALVAEVDERAEQETLSTARGIEQKESLALAKTIAQAEIRVRVRATNAPRSVVEFLAQQWIKLLLVVHVSEGEDSDAWKNALETIDLLLWSVEPKDNLEERRALVATIPDLLKRLADGLNAAGVEDAVRIAFFGALRKFHFEAIGKTAKEEAASEPQEPQTAVLPEQIEVVAESALLERAGKPEEPAVGTQQQAEKTQELPPFVEQQDVGIPAEEPAIHAIPERLQTDQPEVPGLEWQIPDLTPTGASQPSSMPAIEPPGQLAPTEGLQLVPIPHLEPAVPEPASGEAPQLAPIPVPDFPPILVPEAKPTIAPEPDVSTLNFDLPVIEPSPAPTARPVGPPAVKPSPAGISPAPKLPAQSEPVPPVKPPATARTPAPASTPQPDPASQRATTPPQPQAGAAPPAKPPATAPRPPVPPGTTAAKPPASAPRPAVPEAKRPVTPAAAKPASSAAPLPKADSLDFTAAVTVKNPFGAGEVLVNDLDFTQPAPKTAGGKRDADDALPDNFGVGSWVEIRDTKVADSRVLAKLSFVTPLKTRYLFVNRRGSRVLECSRAELARRFGLGEINVTVEAAEVPLFDRIAEGVIGKLAGSK